MSEAQPRLLTYAEAVREGIDQAMERDPGVFLFGLGVDDPKRIFGTTKGLAEKYGPQRVFDVPCSENGLTGIAVGAATLGMRPILTHQRLDFALLSLDQIINSAAKWHYMFAGKHKAPLVITMVIGRGWGQGPQHSQSLQALFAHIPGLKVVMPANPADAKGLMIGSILDDGPVVVLQHWWLHEISGPVAESFTPEPLCKAKVVRKGKDLTIVAASYMVLESFRAAEHLAEVGIDVEVVDLRTVSPFDGETVERSVLKTGRLLVADTGHTSFGISAELIAWTTERLFGKLKAAPCRVASPDSPVPTTPALAMHYYPRSHTIAARILKVLGREGSGEALKTIEKLKAIEEALPSDVPDRAFTGPF